jgi:protein-tyrosine phosphatase
MTGFVDIHSHVLYGVDDGAETIADSLAMLRIAEEAGTADLVLTPHANSRYRFDAAVIEARLAELQAQTSVRLHPGCDFHLQGDNIADALAHPEKYTLNRGMYLLVEFPDVMMMRAADEILRELREAGFIPIISHPERNIQLRTELREVERWVSDGCLLQITATSFTGLFGRDAQRSADDFLARGLAQIVASDAHDVKHRTPDLRAAYERLCRAWNEDTVRRLFVDNPAAVVRSDTFDPEPPVRRRRWARWFARS